MLATGDTVFVIFWYFVKLVRIKFFLQDAHVLELCKPSSFAFFVFCFSVIFACVCYTRNVINVTRIGRQISELMFLW